MKKVMFFIFQTPLLATGPGTCLSYPPSVDHAKAVVSASGPG